ncbi:hypothetical protein A6V39_00330 [Candidatus Mycoplasma haematobovis]|uniref:Uncharacterized protein n=1 Tax=Candidatus Mycoplasma haematobovis TaxID=432608 RepID=A0A1A9QEX0_9MOLU|nr:hypothetical protein [Candidatus Mycoplasma haematobovis]OAL10496.1 hypothetical protein A6V39_00330 [Candidatus Mycoplasma haematobovis]
MAPKQIAILGTSVSAIGGGIATSTYFLLPDNSIKAQIIKENKKILDYGAKSEFWEIKLHTLTSASTTQKYSTTLAGNTWDKLRDWCKTSLSKGFTEKNKDYTSIKDLCTVPTNKEKLAKENKNIAVTRELTQKVQSYKTTGNNALSIDISGNDNAIASNMEIWCQSALENEYTETNKNTYPLTLKWCTREGR